MYCCCNFLFRVKQGWLPASTTTRNRWRNNSGNTNIIDCFLNTHIIKRITIILVKNRIWHIGGGISLLGKFYLKTAADRLCRQHRIQYIIHVDECMFILRPMLPGWQSGHKQIPMAWYHCPVSILYYLG